MAADLSTDALHGGQLNAAISNAVVHAFAEYIGRGPTKARTSIRDDVVFCVLENNLTKAEHSLVAGGREQIVLETRRAHQSTMREQLVAEVERLTRRRVIAFMSDNHIDPDIATETFVLEPLEFDLVGEDGLNGLTGLSSPNGAHD